MTNHTSIIRAIGAEFIARKLKSLVLIIAVMLLVFIVSVIILATLNIWWLVLFIPLVLTAILGIVTYIVASSVIRKIRPKLNKFQQGQITNFVDKLERMAENVQTPMPFIVLRVLSDITLKRKRQFLQNFIYDSTSLHKDYLELTRNFYK